MTSRVTSHPEPLREGPREGSSGWWGESSSIRSSRSSWAGLTSGLISQRSRRSSEAPITPVFVRPAKEMRSCKTWSSASFSCRAMAASRDLARLRATSVTLPARATSSSVPKLSAPSRLQSSTIGSMSSALQQQSRQRPASVKSLGTSPLSTGGAESQLGPAKMPRNLALRAEASSSRSCRTMRRKSTNLQTWSSSVWLKNMWVRSNSSPATGSTPDSMSATRAVVRFSTPDSPGSWPAKMPRSRESSPKWAASTCGGRPARMATRRSLRLWKSARSACKWTTSSWKPVKSTMTSAYWP
mmetsp:Transcript_88759/g.287407  ORF Transcript_88759/g.287407 Transcript_88759/m.287407 type:complete len:299 (-) Transcript_88759:1174-2070(-)